MIYDEKQCIEKAEEVFSEINQQVGFSKYITPINFQEENKLFKEAYLSKKAYNPIYRYRDRSNINLKKLFMELDGLSFTDTVIGHIYSEEREIQYNFLKLMESIGNDALITIHSKKMDGVPNILYLDNARKAISLEATKEEKSYCAEDLCCHLKKCLDSYRLDWKVIISYEIPGKVIVSTGNKTIYINGNQRFSLNDMERLCAHEVSTHVLRSENGAKREYEIFKNGTSNSLKTEEGLALYNEDMAGKINIDMLKIYAARFISTVNMESMSFYEMVQEIEPFIGIDNAIYVVSRIKIGMSDTSKSGGFIRDYVYFQGYIDIKEALTKEPTLYSKLYYGSIGLNEIPKLHRYIEQAEKDNNILLPNFL
ncbi:tyrosine/phenylalanine carboxypeptidase domain-containing protein [Clostridium sp. C8-1-8]|uniref:tyrosine/phenylalanine carboxypeptidase domain-containing protein n=1 Tax=Clostridium sp. C8-1-8 TaxID=2698831 RepID=UPI00136BC544|nr:tyrosine/phenylalanine carboxypeptidase domain-containing protein [Clostridium sp. C8-1-8]